MDPGETESIAVQNKRFLHMQDNNLILFPSHMGGRKQLIINYHL